MSSVQLIFVPDDEYGEKSVCISLDGREAELSFIDHAANEMSVSELPPTSTKKTRVGLSLIHI